MAATTVRILIAAIVCVAVSAGGVGLVAAESTNDAAVDSDVDVGSSQGGGNLSVDCAGDVTLTHDCDKGGQLNLGPLWIDYEGYNWARTTGLQGGGGDTVVVGANDRSVGVTFDCALAAEVPSGNPCPVDVTSDGESVLP